MVTATRLKDFVVRITSKDGKYYGQVKASPAGDSDPELLREPFGAQGFENTRLKLENAVLKGVALSVRGPASTHEKVLRQFGSQMFDILFKETAEISRLFERSRDKVTSRQIPGLRIKLHVEPEELSTLPWEFMFDQSPQTYLCLGNTSPILRHFNFSPADRPQIGGKLNVLAMIANPHGSWKELDVARERQNIDNVMNHLKVKPSVHFEWVPGDTLKHLIDAVRSGDWHVFHFIGHGGFDEDDEAEDAEGYLVLGDGEGGAQKVYASNLANALQGSPSLQLAVLNCCESAKGNSFASPGAALARSGVDAVVAMQYPISDKSAITFSAQFYQALVAGQPVERALTEARVLMRQDSTIEWGIPVLFSRSNTDDVFVFTPPEDIASHSVLQPAQPISIAPQTAPGLAPVAPAEAIKLPTEHDNLRRQSQAQLRRLFGSD